MSCDDRLGTHNSTTTNGQTTTIEQLCDNILLDVFTHLNAKDLKNASLVDRRWNELIGSSALTMRKFRFRIENERYSRRNHQNFAIEATKTTDWTRIPIRPGRVRTFHIQGGCDCDTIDCDELFTFLSCLTELEELSFENVRLSDGTNQIVHRTKVPKLKTLRVIGNDFTILAHIDAQELQQLQCIREFDNSSRPIDFESIAQSMVRFARVESLTLWNCMEAFQHIDVQQVKCQLNSFEAYHPNICATDVTVFIANLRQFFLLQAESLRDLTFDCSMFSLKDRLETDFLRISFNTCTKLTSLDIRDLSIPRDVMFYRSLSPNYSLRNLQVQRGVDRDVVDGLLRNCPKLKRLEVDLYRLSGDSINSIAKFCPELVHLHIYELAGCIRVDVFLEHLKCLNIYKLENSFEPLLALTAMCPNLEQIRIDKCDAESFPMDIVTRLPSMKKLRIAGKLRDILEIH